MQASSSWAPGGLSLPLPFWRLPSTCWAHRKQETQPRFILCVTAAPSLPSRCRFSASPSGNASARRGEGSCTSPATGGGACKLKTYAVGLALVMAEYLGRVTALGRTHGGPRTPVDALRAEPPVTQWGPEVPGTRPREERGQVYLPHVHWAQIQLGTVMNGCPLDSGHSLSLRCPPVRFKKKPVMKTIG